MQGTDVENVISNIGTVFAIISVVLSIIKISVDKFLPYLKTKIKKNRYKNVKVWIWLIYYEMFVSILAVFIAGILAIILGKDSTWDTVTLKEHVIALLVIWWIYIFGIILIIYKRRESIVCKVNVNILLASIVYVIVSMNFWNTLGAEDSSVVYDVGMYITIFLQFVCNIDVQRIGNIQYEIGTVTGKKYKDCEQIVKRGNFCILCYENNKKMIEIPNERIEEIHTKVIEVEQKPYMDNATDEEIKGRELYKKMQKTCVRQDDMVKRKNDMIDEIGKVVKKKTTEEQTYILENVLSAVYRQQEMERLIALLAIIFVIMLGVLFAILQEPIIVYFSMLSVVAVFVLIIFRIEVIQHRGFIEAVVIEYKDTINFK